MLLAAFCVVPRFGVGFLTHLDGVPIDAFSTRHHTNVHHRFLGDESTSHEPCLRIGPKRVTEETVVPTLLRPLVRFAPIFDGTPVSETHRAVTVHSIIRGSELVGHSLALEEYHVGFVFEILRVAIPLIIERADLCGASQFGWSKVALELFLLTYGSSTSGEHRYRGGASGVVALHHLVKDAIRGDAPVVGGVTAPVVTNLKFVAQTPKDNAGTVAVACNPLLNEHGPQLHERFASAPILVVRPFVYQFVHNEQPFLVGNAREGWGIRIVGTTQGIETESLHLTHLTTYGIVE